MLTVGQINEKISELRSKIAVAEGIVLYLKTHYLPSPDSGAAEMHFTRSDYARVPPPHIQASIADYVDYCDELRAELLKWEETTIGAPQLPAEAAKEPEKPAENAPTPEPEQPKAKNGNGTKPATPAPRKENPSGAGRPSQDQPAAQQPAGGKAG